MNFSKRHACWLGPLIGFFGFVSYFLLSTKFTVLRDSAILNLVIVLLAVVLALSGLVALWKRSSWKGKSLHIAGTLASVSFAVMLFWYVFDLSYQMPGTSDTTLALEEAPDFSLASATGDTVSLSSFRGKKVALSFYRGFW